MAQVVAQNYSIVYADLKGDTVKIDNLSKNGATNELEQIISLKQYGSMPKIQKDGVDIAANSQHKFSPTKKDSATISSQQPAVKNNSSSQEKIKNSNNASMSQSSTKSEKDDSAQKAKNLSADEEKSELHIDISKSEHEDKKSNSKSVYSPGGTNYVQGKSLGEGGNGEVYDTNLKFVFKDVTGAETKEDWDTLEQINHIHANIEGYTAEIKQAYDSKVSSRAEVGILKTKVDGSNYEDLAWEHPEEVTEQHLTALVELYERLKQVEDEDGKIKGNYFSDIKEANVMYDNNLKKAIIVDGGQEDEGLTPSNQTLDMINATLDNMVEKAEEKKVNLQVDVEKFRKVISKL